MFMWRTSPTAARFPDWTRRPRIEADKYRPDPGQAAALPPRLLRSALPRALLVRLRRRRPVLAGAASVPRPATGPAGLRGRLARLLRRALYTEPALRLLGHMLLVVARRP